MTEEFGSVFLAFGLVGKQSGQIERSGSGSGVEARFGVQLSFRYLLIVRRVIEIVVFFSVGLNGSIGRSSTFLDAQFRVWRENA